MKGIIFGATGMVVGGVMRECLLDPGVERVLTVAGWRQGNRTEITRDGPIFSTR